MGVTIRNKNNSIDMGYAGFFNLRKTIAGIYSEQFKRLYDAWCRPFGGIPDDEGNERLAKLYEKGILSDEDDVVLDFLFAPDAGGKISAKGCKRLWQVIKDYDDKILYGYQGRPDCAMFKDFKNIVEDCAKNRLVLTWH